MSNDENRVNKSGGSDIMMSRAVMSIVEGMPRSRQDHLVEDRGSKIKRCKA